MVNIKMHRPGCVVICAHAISFFEKAWTRGATNGVGKLLIKCPTCPYKGNGTYFFFTNISFADSFVKEYAFLRFAQYQYVIPFYVFRSDELSEIGCKITKKNSYMQIKFEF